MWIKPKRSLLLVLPILLPCLSPVADADTGRRSAIVDAVEKTRGGIVNLRTLRVIPARFENVEQGRVRGLGTGVLIDPRGYIVTNYHVVEDVNEIEARTADGTRYPARLVGDDKRNDLAILKIDSSKTFPYLPMRGAGEALLGETVIAIGNPYGLEDSVTIGIVSSINRELPLPNGETFRGLIQTDASINPGNSGGPLITVDGELLGINVAIRSNAQGIAFAIPTATVRDIISNVMRNPNSLTDQGIHVNTINASGIVKAGGVVPASGAGLFVDGLDPASPAAKAGLMAGDEILGVNGQPIDLRFDLDRQFWERKPGETLVFRVRRQGEEIEVPMALGGKLSEEDMVWESVGIRARSVVEPVRRAQPKWLGGLFITSIRPDSPAAQAGLKPGDILAGLHKHMTTDHSSVLQIMRMPDFGDRQPVVYDLLRDGRVVEGRIQLFGLK